MNLRFYLPLSALFTVLFAVVYGGASWLSVRRDPPPAPHFAFEAAIPFVPEMAWIYLSVPLALALTPFILRTKRELVPFFFALTAQLLAAGLCYLLYPVAPAWPPRVAEGPGAIAFHLADALNLDDNELPSLHLAFAASVALVFGRRFGPAVRLLLWIWVAAVGTSTLMLHEHHVLDVLTGTALGILAVVTVQRWTERREFLDALRIEVLCLRELARFTRRHPRYLLTGLAIWSHSLRRWRDTRLLRAGFCLAQHIDDVLDGDRPVSGNPVAYARGLLHGEPGPLAPLAAFVLAELDRRGMRGTLEELVEVLVEDRRRMDARRTMDAAALSAHHRKTFRLSLDLTLVAAGSDLRAEDAPEIVEALAWCSPVRDLEEDLAKGLINLPAELLAMVPGVMEPRALLASEPVKAWLRMEHRRAAEALAPLPSPTSPVLATLHRALTAYEKKYRRLHLMPTPKLRASWRWLAAPYGVLEAERARRGPTFWMDLALVGRALVTGDPALVREIASRHDLEAGSGITALRRVLGDRSLITLDGDDHAARRRLVGPLFRRGLESLDLATIEATREALDEIPTGDTFAAYDFARRISLRAIVRLLLPGSPVEEAGAGRLIESYLLSFASPWVLFLRPLHVDLGPLTPWGRAVRHRDRLRELLRERIRVARRDPGIPGGLARIAREGADLPEDEVIDETLALLLFGHDTGAAALAWGFAHIWGRPEVAARVREEDDPAYLEACLKESLRLCPVVVHVTRIAPRDTALGPWNVPAGARIFPSAYLAQRDPEVFPEPGAFRPERFLEGRSYEGSWFPFGLGARTCIGNHFALRQMHLIAATAARHADLALAPGYEPAPVRRLVLVLPRHGTPMVLRGRREAA